MIHVIAAYINLHCKTDVLHLTLTRMPLSVPQAEAAVTQPESALTLAERGDWRAHSASLAIASVKKSI